jgi:hypothetical protein
LERPLSESLIVQAVAMEACERITRKTIRILQKMDHCLMAGDDSGLTSIWDEVCVQIQGQESGQWNAYESTIQDILTAEFGKLSSHEQDAIWLQTDEGENWTYGDEDRRGSAPGPTDDSVELLMRKFLFSKAADWTNKRISQYLERSYERD